MDSAQLRPETVSKADVSGKRKKKHLLGVPIPGTQSTDTSSSSTTAKK
jgi:hypothetical protein